MKKKIPCIIEVKLIRIIDKDTVEVSYSIQSEGVQGFIEDNKRFLSINDVITINNIYSDVTTTCSMGT